MGTGQLALENTNVHINKYKYIEMVIVHRVLFIPAKFPGIIHMYSGIEYCAHINEPAWICSSRRNLEM